jgi:hypothetical protein
MKEELSFRDYVIVSCGTLAPELNYLRKQGFLDAARILYATPGRHEVPKELERQLMEKINLAKQYSTKIIIVYGGKYCYVNTDDPYRTIDTVIQDCKNGGTVFRIEATHCVDMLLSKEQRDEISDGVKTWWLTPGWIIYRDYVFQDWDKGKANENFPQHTGGAVLLDGIGFWERYSEEHPEKILEFSDWMGIEVQPHKITLERLKNLLVNCIA